MQLLTNARILTLNNNNTIAESALIDHGTILAVGSAADFEGLPTSTKIINLDGATVIPGFTDAHLHLLHFAKSLTIIDCDVPSRAECLNRIREAVQQTPPGTWIRGHGWNNHHWQENEVSREILDTVSPEHPVYLSNKSLHGGWANSLALQYCEVDQNTTDPDGGRIGRDSAGMPNGMLYESAVSLITDQFPEVSEAEAVEIIHQAQEKLFQRGITTTHDFDRIVSFKALQQLDAENKLKLRVRKSLPVEAMDEIIAIGLQTGFGNSHLTFGGIKLFADGALGTKTAAMLSPYKNTDEVGMLLLSKEELRHLSRKASRNGLQLAIHAIGDLANRTVIQTFHELRQWESEQNIVGLPHRVEHLQTCQLEDIQLLKGINVVASVQPIHLASDVIAAEKWLGSRCEGTYAFNTFRNTNIPLVFGSDAPVEQPDCLLGIHTAVYRTQRDDTPAGGWQPQEKLSPIEALKGFCTTVHQHLPMQNAALGQVSPGYKADLVVLNDFSLNPEQQQSYKKLKIQKTMIDGQWVWEV